MVKTKTARIKKQIDNFLFDHYIFKTVLEYLGGFFIAAVAALIFAFGFSCFTSPSTEDGFILATGGVSGISQVIALGIEFITGKPVGANVVQAIGYSLLNVPLLIFSFLKLGRRFSIFTAINVALSSLFIWIFSQHHIGQMVADFSFNDDATGILEYINHPLNTILVRVIFAAICTGLASALAFVGGISCGGIDIVSCYIATRKSTQIGKYGVIINAFIVTTYALLKGVQTGNYIYSLYSIFFSIIYLMLVGLIIDAINLRNKKMLIQIITSKEHMPEIIIANFPHSATIINGHGAYSGAEKIVLWMAVSSSEVNKVVNVAKKVDEHAFIAVTSLKQVYGNFYIKPLE